LAGLDKTKLRQRACAIAECADTNVLFNAGESDESLDDADFKEPSSIEAPQKAPEDLADNSIPLSPVAMTWSWQLELATLLRSIRLARQWPPNCVKASLLVCMCVELMPCLVTSCSHTLMTFHPKSLIRRSLIVHELDFA
jgi:hypothetical protein